MNQELITLRIPGLTRQYTFFHTSDCHIQYVRPEASEEDKAFTQAQVKRWTTHGILPEI